MIFYFTGNFRVHIYIYDRREAKRQKKGSCMVIVILILKQREQNMIQVVEWS